MAKLTLHRALGELKLTENKITKKISQLNAVGYKKEGGLVNSTMTVEEFNKNSESQVDSIKALIARKQELKTKIVLANASTTLTVAGVEMSIADAITKKDNIYLETSFLTQLKTNLRKNQTIVEQHNAKIDNNALELVRASLGSEADTSSEQAESISDSYVKTNAVELVDPIGIQTLIEELEEKIDNFKTEVDACLSEINATTFIEIED